MIAPGLYWPQIRNFTRNSTMWDDQREYELFKARVMVDDAWQQLLRDLEMWCLMVLPESQDKEVQRYVENRYDLRLMASAHIVALRRKKLEEIEARPWSASVVADC
jgi:hypothetical protein